MCLIILVNDTKALSFKDMETAYKRNSDGFGIMYMNKENKFISEKFLPKNFNEVKNFFNIHKVNAKGQIAIHFRFTTEGKTNKKNCHPFISYRTEERQIGMMHNGARLPIPLINKNYSDTWHFNEHYLKTVLRKNPNLILNSDYQSELEDHIEDFTSDIVTRFSDELSQELLDKHQNDIKVLTSGSLSFLVHKIGAKLGIENCFGTDPEYLEGQFTGRVDGRPNFSEEKVRRINKWMDSKKFDQIFSYSDSIHDLPLLEFADFPMAISPDKELRRVAKEREWLIDDRRSS